MPGTKGTMREFKEGSLHSGSKKGPVVTNQKQAVAIGMSEERKAKVGSKEHRKKHMSEAIKKAHSDYRKKYRDVDEEETNPFNTQRG